jgi:hypothetical protein
MKSKAFLSLIPAIAILTIVDIAPALSENIWTYDQLSGGKGLNWGSGFTMGMRYFPESPLLGTSTFDFTGTNPVAGTFLWRDQVVVAAAGNGIYTITTPARKKMQLDNFNVLSIYNTAGTTAPITLNGGTGRISLIGEGAGIDLGGIPVLSLVNGQANFSSSAVFPSIHAGSLNAQIISAGDGSITAGTITATSTINASTLTVMGGLTTHEDAFVKGIRAGRGGSSPNPDNPNAPPSNQDSTAFGQNALSVNTIGVGNSAFGKNTMQHNTAGAANVAVGSYAMNNNVAGHNNVAVGYSALMSNQSGYCNVAIGVRALTNSQGNYNVATGYQALGYNTSGEQNSALGYGALAMNSAGHSNTSVGTNSLHSSTIGIYNSALGCLTLFNLTSGGYNVAIGSYAGFSADNNSNGQVDAGETLTTANNNIYIGQGAAGKNDDDNTIVIGTGAISKGPKTTVLGSSLTKTTHIFGEVRLDKKQGDIPSF